MQKLILTLATCLLISAAGAIAQKPTTAKFAGSYNATLAFTIGPASGLCGAGTGTVSRFGSAAFTFFFPSDGTSGTVTASVNKLGRVIFNAPETGYVTLFRGGRRIFGMGSLGNGLLGGATVAVSNYPVTD